MQKIKIKNANIKISAIIFALFFLTFVILSLTGVTGADFWGRNKIEFEGTGNLPSIEIELAGDAISGNNLQHQYTEATSKAFDIKLKSSSTINGIVRVTISGAWSNDLPIYTGVIPTVNFGYSSDWTLSGGSNQGSITLYYNYFIREGETIPVLNQLEFPGLASEYHNQTFTLNILAEGLQANTAAIDLWKGASQGDIKAPSGWAPTNNPLPQ